MHFHYGGQVGIGTLTPGAKLDVNGTIKMNGFLMPGGAIQGAFCTDDGGYGSWQPLPGKHGAAPGRRTTFRSSPALRRSRTSPLYVAGDSIGIGTKNPAARLNVVTTGPTGRVLSDE